MPVRVSRRQLERVSRTVRQASARIVELADGQWHRVVPGSESYGTYRVRCRDMRVAGRRTAGDMVESDVCAACNAAEREMR